jgi:hypothetical protein
MQDDCINYMHFGSALQHRESMPWRELQGVRRKSDVLSTIRAENNVNTDLVELVRSYGPSRSQRLDTERFQLDMSRSLIYQAQFKALGCRGFSYRVADDIEFPDPFAKHITLRLALLTSKDLFYPPRVRTYLRRVNNNHYFSGGFPSIGFAFGTKLGHEWFVFVLQSDLAVRTPSYVKSHFRGWARILFSTIMRKARNQAKAIYICRASDALKTCHPLFPKPQQVPYSWQVTYDGTADFFGMQLVRLQKPVNMQLYPRQKPILVEHFYKLDVKALGKSDLLFSRGGKNERCKSDRDVL